jgi:hypothetical protein
VLCSQWGMALDLVIANNSGWLSTGRGQMSIIHILPVQRACGIPCVKADGSGAGFAFAVNVWCGPLPCV